MGLGERLLAGEAESFIENALTRGGALLVDESIIPELADALRSGSQPGMRYILSALQPHARYVIVVHAEYLGDRELFYMGRRDVAHESRLTVRPFDLQSGSAVGPGLDEKLEYTQLNVQKVVASTIRPRIRAVIGQAGRR